MLHHKRIYFFALFLSCCFCSFSAQAMHEASSDTLITTSSYFADGSQKVNTHSYYNQEGIIYKVVYESFRKNGSRRNVTVLNYGVEMQYKARYAKNNQVIYEKFFSYNHLGTLIQIETKRNGQSSFRQFDTDLEGRPLESN